MKFSSNQTGMYLNSKWNSIPSTFKNSTAIIGGSAVLLPAILRVEDIEEIMSDNSIVDEAKLYIRKVFSDKLVNDAGSFTHRYIPDQDTYVIGPYICLWITDLNEINRLVMIEIKDIKTINQIINNH
jgi:hypothetical protein